jgi:hypothetical protein
LSLIVSIIRSICSLEIFILKTGKIAETRCEKNLLYEYDLKAKVASRSRITLPCQKHRPCFYPFRIPDPKTATKEMGEKKLVVKPFLIATNFTKLKIILFVKC